MFNRHLPVHLRLIAWAMPQRWWLVLSIATLAGASVFTVATPKLVEFAIDTGLQIREHGAGATVAEGNMATVVLASVLLVVAAVLRGAFMYGQTYLGERVSQSIAYDLRNAIYDRLQRLSYAYHDDAQIGQIMSRATQDVEGVRMFVSMGVLRFLFVIVLVAVSYALMFQTNVKVAAIAFIFVPIVATQASVTSLMLRPIWLKVQDLQGQMATVLQENLTGQRVVKAFARQRHEQEKFDGKVAQLFTQSYRTARFQAFNSPFMEALWLLSLAIVFWAGATEIAAGRMTTAQLISFQLYLTLLQVPVRSVGFIINMFARAHSAGARIFEILDAESAVQEKPGAPPIAVTRGHVRFEDVSFGYDAYAPVLKHIDIDALPGQTIALLGPTGSGKSTIVNLLPRFYDATGGAITIDGQDIRDVTLDSLREAIGIVQQDVFLFAATIRENIAYGRPDASEQEILEAAQAARIHEFIEQLPDGYDTWVGERGTTLSGGQRQRIAIARTLLRDPRVLIFDDSTASVDMRTEFLIQEALRNLMRGRTTFVIAQRLRTVKEASQILVMRNGEIVERGTHDELIETGGFYGQIYDLELRDQEEAQRQIEAQASAPSTPETGGGGS